MTKSDFPDVGVARFKIVRKDDGRFGWELINSHGTPEAGSIVTYDTEDEAVASAEHVQQVISQLPIHRL